MVYCDHESEHEHVVARVKQTMPSEEDIATLAGIFKVLGEPSRMRILLALMEGEMCVYHIVEACGGTQSATSHQLRILRDNRVIKSRRDGKNIVYSIADDHIRNIIRMSVLHLGCEVNE